MHGWDSNPRRSCHLVYSQVALSACIPCIGPRLKQSVRLSDAFFRLLETRQWRRRESNPRLRSQQVRRLHVQPTSALRTPLGVGAAVMIYPRGSSRPLRAQGFARRTSRLYDGESGVDGVHLVTGAHAARANSFCFTSELADMGWSNSFRRSRP